MKSFQAAALPAGIVLLVLFSQAQAESLWPADRLFPASEPWVRTASESGEASLDNAPRRSRRLQNPSVSSQPETETRAERGSESGERDEGREDDEDRLETDRDSFTPATTTVGRGRIVIESAHTFVDNRQVAETNSFPETIVRFGLTKRLELRVGWNYEVGGAGNATSGDQGSGAENPEPIPGPGGAPEEGPHIERSSRMAYGAKLALTEQDGIFPQSVVIVQGFTPTTGPSSTTTVVGTYAVGWTLPGRCMLDAAVRYGTAEEEGDHFQNLAPSVVLRVPLDEKWTAHAEWFGIFSDHRETNTDIQFFSPGLHYLVTPDLEVGVRVGWGLTDDSSKFFCNSGLGLRF